MEILIFFIAFNCTANMSLKVKLNYGCYYSITKIRLQALISLSVSKTFVQTYNQSIGWRRRAALISDTLST